MKMTCTRPDWSDASNDYCACDDPSFEEILEAGEEPCQECIWWKEANNA